MATSTSGQSQHPQGFGILKDIFNLKNRAPNPVLQLNLEPTMTDITVNQRVVTVPSFSADEFVYGVLKFGRGLTDDEEIRRLTAAFAIYTKIYIVDYYNFVTLNDYTSIDKLVAVEEFFAGIHQKIVCDVAKNEHNLYIICCKGRSGIEYFKSYYAHLGNTEYRDNESPNTLHNNVYMKDPVIRQLMKKYISIIDFSGKHSDREFISSSDDFIFWVLSVVLVGMAHVPGKINIDKISIFTYDSQKFLIEKFAMKKPP